MKSNLTYILFTALIVIISSGITMTYGFLQGMKMRNCYIAFADDNPAVISDYKEIDKRMNEMSKRKNKYDAIAQFN